MLPYIHTLTVPPAAIDLHGHVNNVVFIQWMQDAAIAHSESVGGVAAISACNALWVVRSHQIQYRLPAFLNDTIEVRTWVIDCRMVSSRRKYEFHRITDNAPPALIARGETDWVLLDATTFRPTAIPQHIQDLYAPPIDLPVVAPLP